MWHSRPRLSFYNVATTTDALRLKNLNFEPSILFRISSFEFRIFFQRAAMLFIRHSLFVIDSSFEFRHSSLIRLLRL